jgi:ubiquinone/menaquinone biosynthesis C-methylase UbiE
MPRPHSSNRDASRRYHDRVARQYDKIYDDPYWAFHDELTWRFVKPHVPRDLSAACLDLGCGTGKWGLKLLKTGFATTFVDHAAAMIERTRGKVEELGPKARKATLLVADIVDLSALPSDHFSLTLAMGDPLSICSDAQAAAREMFRITKPGGIIIATADNKLAALDFFAQQGKLDELEAFIRSSRTHWLTENEREQFELTTFTPATLRKLFEKVGFSVVDVFGKTILPIREHRRLLEKPDAIERLLQIEMTLAKDTSTAARAGHLQIIAKKPDPG